MGTFLASLALILAVAYLCARLARLVRQPAVVGEIIGGLALGPSLLGLLPGNLTELLFPLSLRPYLEVLAQIGLVLFMFGVGYQLDVSHLKGTGRRVTAVSLASVAVPFGMGSALAVAFYPWLDRSQLRVDGVLAPALFLGAAMSITAFPVLARIITERGMQKHRVGTMALVCAAVQDFLAWCILPLVVAVATADGTGALLGTALAAVAFVVVLALVVRPGLAWLLDPRRRWSGGMFMNTVLICGLLICAGITDQIGLHAVFGAFAFGTVVPRRHIDATAPEVPERIEQTSLLFLPVFFTVTGLSVHLGELGGKGLAMLAAVIVVACAGKFVGAVGAARLTGVSPRESMTLGILLNARGLTELVILNVGLGLGVMDTRLFSAMVVMAVVTTVMTGPLLLRVHRDEDGPTGRAAAPEVVSSGR